MPTRPKEERKPTIVLRINPGRVAKLLVALVVGLVLMAGLAESIRLALPTEGYGGIREIANRFDLDREGTVPAWWSSAALLGCAGLLALITFATTVAGRGFRYHWAFLALTFALLSLDESASLHEILIVPLRRRLELHGVFYFAWVIPGFVAVALFAFAYLRFLAHLPRRSRFLFLLSGALYVGGALGVELFGGMLAESEGFTSLRYTLVMTLEESLEMAGVLTFLYTLLDYLSSHFPNWRTQMA